MGDWADILGQGGRQRPRLYLTLGVVVLLICGLLGGSFAFVRSLGPLDLKSVEDGSVIVVDRHDRLLRAFTTADGRWKLPLKTAEVDPVFITLLETYEDRRFRQHMGVDPVAFLRAGWQLIRYGRVVSGGSTLSMQVARLLEPREERTVIAKARQVVRALQLESAYSKQQILDFYLVLAPYGGNLEGIRAASLSYFGKEPKRLTLAEAALLVALPQSPEGRRPDRFQEGARQARARVLARAQRYGVISTEAALAAEADPVPSMRRVFPMLAAQIAERVRRERTDIRVHRLTLDAKLQASLEALAQERSQAAGGKVSAALLVVENATGAVLAHVGGAEYLSQDRAGSLDLAQALRSPGSALKPFIYAFAFESGLAHPETVLDDRPSRFAGYAPENFDLSFQGTVTARKALQQSLNVPAVELLAELGPHNLLSRLRSAGADVQLPKESPVGLAIGLGGVGIRLTDLTQLYTGLARGGQVVPLHWRKGQAMGEERRLTDPVPAFYVADILKESPPPFNAVGGRFAFKTGTSYGYRDAWCFGYDRRYTVGVWVGRPDGAPVPGMTGRSVAAPVIFDAFSRIGGEPEGISAPKDALFATTARLPPPLRHIRKDSPKTVAATTNAALRIAFPPDGARVDLGFKTGAETTGLALKINGGVLPLTILVNGQPVPEAGYRRQALWQPDGAGFARITVIDAAGATESVTVRLE